MPYCRFKNARSGRDALSISKVNDIELCVRSVSEYLSHAVQNVYPNRLVAEKDSLRCDQGKLLLKIGRRSKCLVCGHVCSRAVSRYKEAQPESEETTHPANGINLRPH